MTTDVTRSLLRCGVIAGPFYLLSGVIQGLVRDGFDLSRHSLSLLSNGPYGWIQTATFVVAGSLTIAAAAGLRRAATGSRVGPWLVGVFGAGIVAAGIFAADPMDGFPIGTPPGPPVSPSQHGMMHFVVAGIGFFSMIAACFVFARLFGRRGRPGLAKYSALAGLLFLVGFMALASGTTGPAAIGAFWIGLTSVWVWLALVSSHFSKDRTTPA